MDDKNSIRLGNINAGRGFKMKWSDVKKVYHTCELHGKKSDECKRVSHELGVDITDEI